MLAQLRFLAERYGIDGDALHELEKLFEAELPRVPTHRIEDALTEPAGPAKLAPEDFKRRYEDLGLIGQGGFSDVREVWDRHVGRRVALKVQLPLRSSPEDCARFRQEVKITARLQHPGVVPLYDWGELPDGRIWFTMKRVVGETIGKRIARLHGLRGSDFSSALRRLLDDFRRLCEPVAYAHAQRIIHRDISPQNLMVGDLGEVHVMDWGLARDLSRAVDTLPATGAPPAFSSHDPSETSVRTRVAGTPFYMSPEQARGDIAAMGPASDVYALGAVLYEILGGRPPYVAHFAEGEAPERIVERVCLGPPRPIEEVARPETPKELYSLCRKAMEREPTSRFHDAGALITAVRDWLDGADRQARARRIVDEAHREHRAKIERMREDANRKRAHAREILDRLRPFDRTQEKAKGWQFEDEAADIERQMLREELNWTQKLRSALNEAPDLEEAHAALAEHYAQSLRGAEANHDNHAAISYAALLEEHAGRLRHDERARYEALLKGEGLLTLVTEPSLVQVVIKPYEPSSRSLVPNDKKAIFTSTPIRDLCLPYGSYLLRLSAPGCREVAYPVAIGRGEHWDCVRPGGTAPSPTRLLRECDLGPDDVYVPAGWFIAGGDPHAGESLSRRRVWVDDFVIRKYPVTNAEYIEFLNHLVQQGLAEQAKRHCPRESPGAGWNGDAQLAYAFDEHTGIYSLRAPDLEHALPVVCVDWYSANAYAGYQARRTGLEWRLPSELEWEKAARGVDGRFMPWGDQLEPTWACVSGSHPDRKHVMPVDSYPTDVSPYGVRGMAGNVRDWCIERWNLDGPCVENGVLQIESHPEDEKTDRLLRGGAWISAGDLMRLSVRYAEPPTRRHGVLGFRIARSLRP